MITVDNLTVRFGPATAVDGVSLHVEKGESFGLVGESGSGKSTILRTAVGLTADWTGRIEIDGLDARHTRPRDLARRVQMVFQDPYASLHPRFVIGRAIAEPMRIQGMENIDRRVGELLDMIGLNASFRYRYPHELSGGQRQRVAIARALALQPGVLLLDEPTSALDVSVQAEILNLLADLREELGLTFLIVSHNLAVISHMCDRLMVMQNAQAVETLTRDQLRARAFASDYTRKLIEAT
ncbi:MAG: ABC transporter ATP-binding protein [Rubellimicrobium sp.]|nr:ABC transporter ATP-binding protein [Rubellimicrobium sp.]